MLTTLAIHAEAWLQEEIGAQEQLLRTLERTEAAARRGATEDLRTGAGELEGLLAAAAPRLARRHALASRLAGALGTTPGEVRLSVLVERLKALDVDAERLERLRTELRGLVARSLKAGRRLGAIAGYHRDLFEELCGALCADSPAHEGGLVDARG